MEFDKWQQEIIEHKGSLTLLSGRQVGKSTTVGKRISDQMQEYPGTKSLTIAPAQRQSSELYIKTMFWLMKKHNELIQLHARLGKTTIYVTHDQIEAMTMAQKVVLMQNGHIEQVATPRKIYERPANVFVGRFIGSPKMNFVSARIEKLNDVHAVYVGDTATPLPKGWKLPEKVLSVILGFRPQETRLQNDEPSDLHVLKIPMIVRSLQPLGHDVLINLGSKDNTWTSVAQTSWKKNSVSVGSEVLVHINFSELHFFDAQSKKRINF